MVKSFLTVLLLCSFQFLFAQNWTTIGGNNQHNGRSKIVGPAAVSNNWWQIDDAGTTLWGNSIFTYGDRFVTSRVTFNPYVAIVECRSLTDGEFLWEQQISPTSILYCIGFDEHAVYVHDYYNNYVYALNPADGSVKWQSELTASIFGGNDGVIYACNGDVICNGPDGYAQSTMRLDRNSGAVLWTNTNFVSIIPNNGLASYNGKVYRVEGTIVTHERLLAMDEETGASLYYSDDIPGDPDQENPITVGADGTIYVSRDGGDLFAYRDTGSGFIQLWDYTPDQPGISGHFGIGWNNDLYIIDDGYIRRIDHETGELLNTSLIPVDISYIGFITIAGDGTVYVCDGTGSYFAFTEDLQTLLWQLDVPDCIYSGPVLARNGILITAGSGNEITAYRFDDFAKPVADFFADHTETAINQTVNFFDQSSFEPTTWAWEFDGGSPSVSSEQHPADILFSEPGIHDVTLVATNSLGSDTLRKSCYIRSDDVTGNMMIHLAELALFPNPSDRFMSIIGLQTGSMIEITTIQGTQILKQEAGSEELTIDVSGLSPSVYLITERDATGQVIARSKFLRR